MHHHQQQPPPPDEVELSLEVQVDPATKRILSNPSRCRSVLLDVTVLKPKDHTDSNPTTDTLTASQVRKLLSTLEKKRRHKQNLLDKLKHDDTIVTIRQHLQTPINPKRHTRVVSRSPVGDLKRRDFSDIGQSVEPLFCEIRRSLKNVETRITGMQDVNLIISQTTVEETTSDELVFRGRRYASCPNSSLDLNNTKNSCFRSTEARNCDLKSLLNKNRLYAKNKCMCQHCGIVGLLKESQKHPLAAELSDSSPPPLQQEFSSFKRTLRKPQISFEEKQNFDNVSYIYHLSKRVKLLEERLAIHEERTVPKEYFKRIIRKIVQSFSLKQVNSNKQRNEDDSSCDISFFMPPKEGCKNFTCNKSQNVSREFDASNENNLHCFRTRISYSSLPSAKSGRNLDKSTETDFVNIQKKDGGGEEEENGNIWRWGEEVLRPGIDLKNRIVILLNEILSKFTVSERVAPAGGGCDGGGVCMGGGGGAAAKAKSSQSRIMFRNCDEFEKEKLALKKTYRSKLHASVSKRSARVKIESSDSNGKQEFFKIISKAKASQKEVLWKNIWNQARANGQTKNDKITVKVPAGDRSGGGGGMCEIELTIKEVEEVLRM